MAKDEDYSQDLDDLFGGPDAFEQADEPAVSSAGKTGNSPPMPMPLPMPMPASMSMPAPMPMPMPTSAPSQAEPTTKTAPTIQTAPTMPSVSVSMPPTDLSVAMTSLNTQQDQAQLSLLFQQFLEQQAAGGPPASSLYSTKQVAWPTQLEPKANPPPAGLKISHSRDKNGDNRIGQYDWYDTFPVRENWVASLGDKHYPIKYTKQGELKMPISMDRHAIEAYVRGCAERGIPLRLWIQNVPTMHADRYPNIRYHRCRAHDCPEKGTLGRGAYQVCFDEHPTDTSNGRFDPFYVAGYIHLFCLEEMVSLAHLMTFADVQPDMREFPLEERNPMSLQRDGLRVLENVYREWKHIHHDSYVHAGLPVAKAPRKRDSECLYYNLTKKKLETQPTTRQKMRDRRKGNDISKYHGNLRKRAEFNAAAKKKRKMARFSSDCSSGVDLGDAFNVPQPQPPFTTPSTAKRQRTSSSWTRPALLQTAAANAMQSQLHGCMASPLRRSRRLSSGAAAVKFDNLPTTPSAYASPYGNIAGFPSTSAVTSAPAPVPNTGTADSAATTKKRRQSLNVRTDQVSLALGDIDYTTAATNIDGLVYDFSTAYAYQDPTNASGAHYLHFGQVSTPNGTYGVQTTPVPYDLRPTQARRETAIRQTSARISLTEGIRCDEKRLIQAVNSPRTTLLLKTPLTATMRRASQASRPASRQQPDAVSSPARRVTRSMSRHVSATDGSLPQDFAIDPALMYPQDLDDFPEGYFDFSAFT